MNSSEKIITLSNYYSWRSELDNWNYLESESEDEISNSTALVPTWIRTIILNHFQAKKALEQVPKMIIFGKNVYLRW